MRHVERTDRQSKPRPHNPNNTRIRELSRLARHQFPDGHGDYVLPETPIGQHLAIAIITHLHRAGQRNGKWLADFCASRAPWLDPDEIDLLDLRPDKAQVLAEKLGLTAARRERLHITSIGACDQTAAQRAAMRRERKRKRDREYRRRRRTSRAEWLAANSASRDQPWHGLNMSRATYYRLKARNALPSSALLSQQPRRSRSGETGASTHRKIVGGRRTCLTLWHRLSASLSDVGATLH